MDSLEVENRSLKKDIRQLEEQLGRKRPPSAGDTSSTYSQLLRRENEQLKQEVRGLRERVTTLAHELEQSASGPRQARTSATRSDTEVQVLREKERELRALL